MLKLLTAALALAVAVPALAAPVAPAAACPAGKLQRVRVSEIIPGGSLAGFREAFADHARWYAAHGYKADRLTFSPVMSESGRRRGAGQRLVTIHTGVSNVPRDKQDAAWKAFAAKYKANSRIVSTTLTCMT
ncbi:MAG: hypothetical protein ACKOUT_05935 [Novosphingobium sp.]